MHIDALGSAGLIANYHGTARRAHCLCSCGPERDKGYVFEADAHTICAIVRCCGCRFFHGGGGEPMLNQHFNDLKPAGYDG